MPSSPPPGPNSTTSLVPYFQQLQARTGLKGRKTYRSYTTSFRTKGKVFTQSVVTGCHPHGTTGKSEVTKCGKADTNA